MPANNSSKKTLWTCCGVHTLHDGLSDLTYVLLPLLAQTFGLSLSQVGLIRAAHRVAMAAFQIPAGLIAERFGERNLLALGTYNFFGDVGKFAFGGLVSLLLMLGISWQAPVIGYGVVGIVTAVAVFLWIANTHTPRDAQTALAESTPSAVLNVTKVTKGWGIKNKRGFTALCALEILDSSTRVGFLTFIAFLLIERGIPAGWAALSVPLILVGGMAGKLACGLLAERVGIIRTIVITEVATGIGILSTLMLPGMATFVLLPLIGVALQGTSSVIYSTIGDLVDQNKLPRAFGLIYTIGALCGIAAPLGYGLLGDMAGVTNAIAMIGIAILLTLPLCVVLRPTIPAEPVKI